MSENTPPTSLLETTDGTDAVAAAFDRMGRRMAGLAAAVEGFAARQQEIHGRDYGPDLAKIHDRQQQVHEAVVILNKRPAMQMTVETIAADIAKAGRNARDADHQTIMQAQQLLAASTQKLDNVIGGRIDLHKQAIWLGAAAGVLLFCGLITGDGLARTIDLAVPENWHWPEQRAAEDLNISGPDSGQRLLGYYDPALWHRLLDADRLVRDNAATLAQCRARAKDQKVPVACAIVVSGPAA